MTSEDHATFTIERVFDAPPALVFHSWADGDAKAHWFRGGPEWKELVREHDFRVGGEDELKGQWRQSGQVTLFKSRYFDIVKDRRIVYVYEMFQDAKKISTSLSTIAFGTAGKGTRLTVTEQGVFLDGFYDAGSRERGISVQMDMLAEVLRQK